MTSYYDELRRASDPARRVGWRRRIGQAYRFELVRQFVSADDHLVDVGCGEAALASYLRASGHEGDYLGIELRETRLETEAEVWRGDYRTFDPLQRDVAVAIGALVGAENPGRDAYLELHGWMRRAAPRGLIIAIDESTFSETPWRADPGLTGVRREWLDAIEVTPVTRHEIAITWGEGELCPTAAIRAAFDGPFGPFDAADGAWLAWDVGDETLARGFLNDPSLGDRGLAGLIEERLS